ncbi:MAG: DUF2905 domain-containing protein [Nitrococcus mobilis]|nr:DUF2905 domain-containing protein [Nitrococcus mobilis]
MDFQRLLIIVGMALLVAGLLWPLIAKLGLGRLPGDLAIKKDNFTFYFPITTSIIISVLLTLLFWLFRK